MPPKPKRIHFLTDQEIQPYKDSLLKIIQEVDAQKQLTWPKFRSILNKYPRDGKYVFSKEYLVAAYRYFKDNNEPSLPASGDMLYKLQMKPMRTQSGVTPVTVLTKPFPCPGQCIFCPSDIRMPKSYLSDEPGAQRAERNYFDPYLQTYRRIKALHSIGHNVEKIELIILGGTWSYYPESYQVWFIKEMFRALNEFSKGLDDTSRLEAEIQKLPPLIPKEFDKNFLSRVKEELGRQEDYTDYTKSKEKSKIPDHTPNKPFQVSTNSQLEGVSSQNNWLENAEAITRLSSSPYNVAVTKIIKQTRGQMTEDYEAASWQDLETQHQINESAHCKCVGLVVETRPDHISPEEVIRIRRLGCTKVQIGFQSLSDEVLQLNRRGHSVAETAKAVELLRFGGFKIHAHWMANLYGSSVDKDIADYQKMFQDKAFRPDELKIYPCSLIETADLVTYHQKGLWEPYTQDELLKVVTTTISQTPEYCRLTRIIRDIPGTDIMTGNKVTNFRQLAELEMDKQGLKKSDIRSREIKHSQVDKDQLSLDIQKYESGIGLEYFLQFITEDRQIASFLRLALPGAKEGEKVSGQKHPFISELDGAAIIREVHVYGKALGIGQTQEGRAQHFGLGKSMIKQAEEIAKSFDYNKIAVISAIGTRGYYAKQGYKLEKLYQLKEL
jgi:elongator complex protein 3